MVHVFPLYAYLYIYIYINFPIIVASRPLLSTCIVEGFMEADGLFALEGMHEPGAEQALVEIREALEYYCLNFLRPWLQEYFYRKVNCALDEELNRCRCALPSTRTRTLTPPFCNYGNRDYWRRISMIRVLPYLWGMTKIVRCTWYRRDLATNGKPSSTVRSGAGGAGRRECSCLP